MASHLGRNPFQTKKESKQNPAPQIQEAQAKESSDSLLVRVPAASFMIALRSTLWVKEQIENKGFFSKRKKQD